MLKTHVIVDFYMADAEILARTDKLKAAIDRALDSLDHEVVQESYIQFEPIGVTATVVGKMFCCFLRHSSMDFSRLGSA